MTVLNTNAVDADCLCYCEKNTDAPPPGYNYFDDVLLCDWDCLESKSTKPSNANTWNIYSCSWVCESFNAGTKPVGKNVFDDADTCTWVCKQGSIVCPTG